MVKKKSWAQKLQNLMSEIIQILLSHSSPSGDVQVTFSRFFVKFKMAATGQLFGGLKQLVRSIF